MQLEKINILNADTKEQLRETRRSLYRVIEQIEDELNRLGENPGNAEEAKEYTDKKISELKIPSLEGYATEQYVKDTVKDAVPDLSGYATKEYAESQASNAEKSANDYTDEAIAKLDIPSLDGYATEEYVNKEIAKLDIPSLSGYATEEYVDKAIEGLDLDLSIIGNTDISDIDDGTLTGAVDYLHSLMGDVASVLDAVNRTVV